jgi:hypothetical protein
MAILWWIAGADAAGAAPDEGVDLDELREGAAGSDRELDLLRELSEREQREAKAASRAAREAQRHARSPADLIVSAARARLEAVRAEQAAYEQRLIARRAAIAGHELRHRDLLARLANPGAVLGAVDAVASSGPIRSIRDPRFAELSDELTRVRVLALDRLRTRFTVVPAPPAPPPSLRDEVLALRPRRRAEIDALLDRRSQLERRRGELAQQALETTAIEARYHAGAAAALTGALNAELQVSPELRDELRSLSEATAWELRGEAVQVAVALAAWALERLAQLRELPAHLADWSRIAHILWLLLELLALLVLLRWAMRRWNAWMQAAIAEIGKTLTYNRSAVLLVLLAESAKKPGPALLVLVFALAAHHLFAAVAPEAELALSLLVAVAALRVQLRAVESGCDRMALRAQDRERERQLLAVESHADAAGDEAEAPEPEASPETVSSWRLFPITWRRLTRYVAVTVILLVLTEQAVGRGVFWGLTIRWAWLGAIPLTLLFLRTWRQRIVSELIRRSPRGGAGPLSRWAERHSHRIYGVFIVLAAFVVILARRSAAFVKNHLSNLDSTRRLLAFLFRRRVQRHARSRGRVLDRPHPLPEDIVSQFAPGPVPPSEHPFRAAPLEEIGAAHAAWLEEGAGGSVAIVGAAGMGKSTLLGLLGPVLGTDVALARIGGKITRPVDLAHWLVATLELETEEPIDSEAALIAALRTGERRVVALDDCHNLFLRTVGGFDAWESLTRIVDETGDKVFWVLSIAEAAWDYLFNVGGRVTYFRRILEMPPWTDTELRRLILGRMRRAGYRVNFSDLLVARLEGIEMASQIIRTSQGYFRLLWDYADGNPSLACFFWLRSLVPEAGGRSVRVHLFAAPRIEELEALPDDIAFVLTAVIEHERLSGVELATVTDLPLGLCQFAVRYGIERGYLHESRGRVAVSPLWRQTVQIYLKRKHLLYS